MGTILLAGFILWILKCAWIVCGIVNVICTIVKHDSKDRNFGRKILASVLLGPLYTYFAVKSV